MDFVTTAERAAPMAAPPTTHPTTRHIAGAGTPADVWQSWLARMGVTRHTSPPWLTPAQRLVVVAPHPDDEVLACGGLLHGHLARGGEALVVAVTDGEASHPGDPEWPAPRLAEQRRAESAAGLLRLSAGRALPVLRLGVPDGRVMRYAPRLQATLEALLQPGDVALTTWRWDGHPDHEACGAATVAAAARQGCTVAEAPVWMWHWADTRDPLIPWARLCAVPVAPDSAACKRHALALHATQRTPRAGGLPPILEEAILQRAEWGAEYFFVEP